MRDFQPPDVTIRRGLALLTFMNLRKLTIGRRLIAGFSIVTTVSAIALGFGYLKLAQISSDTTTITANSIPGLNAVGIIGTLFERGYGVTLEHLLATDAAEMDATEKKINSFVEQITVAFSDYEKTIATEAGRKIYDDCLKARKEFSDIRTEVLKLSREGKKTEASQLSKAKLQPAMDVYAQAVATMYDRKQVHAKTSGQKIQSSVSSGLKTAALGGGITIFLSIGTAWVISRSTNRKLREVTVLLSESTLQVASAAGQVSGASQALAEGASEQAASLEETSASLEEISSMTKQNAQNALEAKSTANEARQGAEVGAGDMRDMKSAMNDIKAASDNIAKIIKTIDEIAFQTNILALNAAVEAARAGDAGMGFAVVADEVRNLAQRSAVAAKETAQKIEDCITKSETGVGITAKVSESLELILAKNRRVDELVGEIANASREQSQGIDQVNTAVTQMDKVTQSNAASAEESASAAEELNGQALALKEAVSSLEALVGGSQEVEEKSNHALQTAAPRRRSAPREFSPVKHPANDSFNSDRAVKPNGLAIPLESEFRDF